MRQPTVRSNRITNHLQSTSLVGALVFLLLASVAIPVSAQVRVKKQDRGSYQAPTLASNDDVLEPFNDLVTEDSGEVRAVDFESMEPPVIYDGPMYEEEMHYSGAGGCDGMGCSGCGVCTVPACLPCSPWFASAEVMLYWRRPQGLPALATTSDPGTPRTSAGILGLNTTSILFGQDRVGDKMNVGGRFTLGTWLDNAGLASLTGRFWFTGNQEYGGDWNSTTSPILARPYLDFTTDPNGVPNADVISYPGQRSGFLSIKGSSDVYGADLSMRQLSMEGLGGRIDFMYGYQYMRVNEDLTINSESLILADDSLPVGAMFNVTDQFETRNEFHGAHLGFSGFHREGRWSLDTMMKFGFGALTREARRSGVTNITNGGVTISQAGGGLLVRDSSAGTFTSSTFAWAPEFNVNVGYQARRGIDLSVGYSVVGLTDAVQPWRLVDPQLATDLNDNPTLPKGVISYGSFWVQAIQFGARWNY